MEGKICSRKKVLCPEKNQARHGWKKITRTPIANLSYCFHLLFFPFLLRSFPPFCPSFLPLPLPLTLESFSVSATCASKAMSIFCSPAEMLLTLKCWILGSIFKGSNISAEPLPLAHAFCDISAAKSVEMLTTEHSQISLLPMAL